MASLSPREDGSLSAPNRAQMPFRPWRRLCASLTLVLCAGSAFTPSSAQAAPGFFGGAFGMGGTFSSFGPGHGRMQGPIGRSWPGIGHAHHEPPYQNWDGPRHFGHRPVGPFYPARDPKPYPLPRHWRPIPIIDGGGDVPSPRRLRHPIAVLPVETAPRHINTQHIDKKITVVSHRSVARPSPARALPTRPNSGILAAGEHRLVPDEVLFELRTDVSPQALLPSQNGTGCASSLRSASH